MSPLQKITEAQMDANGVCAAPNVLNDTVPKNKAMFDKMVRSAVAPVVNAAVDAVNSVEMQEATIAATENNRISAESNRVAAENSRVTAETGRKTAENARETNEMSRETVENHRALAEKGRSTAEESRVAAEKNRENNETVRGNAESGRAAAETKRAAAEAARALLEPYNPATAYLTGNKVTKNGSSYQCTADCTGISPPNAGYWLVIAEKGLDGQGSGDMLSGIYDPGGFNENIHNKADKLIPSAAGNLAGLDAKGNLTDSGKKAGDFLSGEAGAVTTPKLANGAVTEAKLDPEIVKKLNEDKGGFVLQITFDAAFAGRPYTVTAPGESYSGTVPAGLKAEVSVKNCRTTYTVEATTADGETYSTTITTGDYFGQYPVRLLTFTAMLKVTTKAGAAVTAVSGGNSYNATADGAGLATLSIKQPGTYAVDAVLDGKTVSVSIAITTDGGTYNLELLIVSTVLEENDWDTIGRVSSNGQGANYWKIGDKKKITINGAVGNTTFSNLSIDAFILGFNHNSTREGSNRIHFQLGKINGTAVALVDSNYGNRGSSASYFQMNASGNIGGWNESSMRKTLLGNSGTPVSPPSGSLLAAMPPDLRAVMKAVTKYSDNTGRGSNNASSVTSTTDYLFLLSEFEYHGSITYANSAEQNYQAQYDYYRAGNSKIKYKHNNTGTAAIVFCRSVYANYSDYFCIVYSAGNATNENAYFSYALAPGFCV